MGQEYYQTKESVEEFIRLVKDLNQRQLMMLFY